MRKALKVAISLAVVAVAIPAIIHQATRSRDDQLETALRGFGFLPLALPTERMSVGSLYYVDPSVRFFHVICRAESSDLEGSVVLSRGGTLKESVLRNGRFASDVKVDLNWLIDGKAKHSHKSTVHYSLADVTIEEIALDKNKEIYRKLMSKPACDEAVAGVLRAGGYVCQGQKTLQATAEFKADLEIEGGLSTETSTGKNIKEIVKLAVETQSGQTVEVKQGRLVAGSSLKYGVAMNPTCLAPPDGRFTRVLPESMLGRVTNFLLFEIVEALWPGEKERPKIVHGVATEVIVDGAGAAPIEGGRPPA